MGVHVMLSDCVGQCGARVWPSGAMCKDCVAGARVLNRNAGLRRAQELAHRYAGLDFDEVGFDRDIDAEAAKERM